MKNEEALQTQGSSLTAEALVYFVESFYRMFKIGIYYPVGHVILDQSAFKCLQQLREISPTLTSISLSVRQNEIFVQGVLVDKQVVAGSELQILLYNLGIESIELSRSVTHKQLLNFVKNILAWRSRLEGTSSLVQFDIGELPETIKLAQQQFLVDGAAGKSDETVADSSANLTQICDSLAKQGLNELQVTQCRSLLEKLSNTTDTQHLEISGFPNATWQDVQDLLCKVVTKSYVPEELKYSDGAEGDINVIASIFQSLGRGLADNKSSEVIEFLVSHLTAREEQPEQKPIARSADKTSSSKQLHRRDALNKVELSVGELELFIYKNSIPLAVLGQISGADNSEQISIIFQLLDSDKYESFKEVLEARLKIFLKGNLTSREVNVIVGGIKKFADSGDNRRFSELLLTVLRNLRNSEGFDSLAFTVELWTRMPHTMHILLWPFVVAELLSVGMGDNRQSFYDATEISSHLHTTGMVRLKPVIEQMEVFKNRTLAPIVFRPAFIYSYRLFGFLLTTSIKNDLIGKILAALLEEPQDLFIEAIAPLIDLSRPEHVDLLKKYLESAHRESQPLELKLAAGQVVVEYLNNVSEEQKENPRLLKTIEATEALDVEGMDAALTSIVLDKKMGFIHTWPRACRKAAKKVLKETKKKNLSELL